MSIDIIGPKGTSKKFYYTVADPRIPQTEWCQLLSLEQKPIILQDFCQKTS